MDVGTKLFYIAVDLILPLMAGYACRCLGKPGEPFFRRMIEANLFVIFPLLAVLTFWVLPWSFSLLWLPVAGVLKGVIPGLAAYWQAPAKFLSPVDQGSYITSALMSNSTTLGGLCAFIVYGEAGYAYMQMVTMGHNAFMFGFGFPLAQYYYQKSRQEGLIRPPLIDIILHRNQLPVVGMVVGGALHAAGISRPEAVGAIVSPLVHISAWTALLPIGHSIDFSGMRQYYRATVDLCVIKFFLTPLAVYLLAGLVIHDRTVLNTILILAMTPTAINAVVAVKMNNLNVDLAMAAFVLTTAVFVGILFPLVLLVISG